MGLVISCAIVLIGIAIAVVYHLPFIGSKWKKDGRVWVIEGKGFMDDVLYCRIVYKKGYWYDEQLVAYGELLSEYKRTLR